MSVLYVGDVTLTSAESPYWVINDVVMSEGIQVTIQPNVEIIFTGDYAINMRGDLTTECSSATMSNDPNLANDATMITIRSQSNSTNQGKITITDTGSASFCNTQFMNMSQGIYIESGDNNVTVDNCAFINNTRGIHRSSSGWNAQTNVTDSIFLDNRQAIYFDGDLQVENCYFMGSGDGWYNGDVQIDDSNWLDIRNNTFMYGGEGTPNNNDVGLYMQWAYNGANIEFNDFSDYYTGIYIHSSRASIKYNTFMNNRRGIIFSTDNEQEVNYNNFIGNTFAFELQSNTNQENCDYNYFSISGTNADSVAANVL